MSSNTIYKTAETILKDSTIELPNKTTVYVDVGLIALGLKVPKKLIKDIYSFIDVLNIAKTLVDEYYFCEAYKALKIAMMMDTENTFLDLIEMALYYNFTRRNIYDEEVTLYYPIEKCISELIPGATWLPVTPVNRKVPDVFLDVNGKRCVGEVKPDVFTKKHLDQLLNYITVFQVDTGYAFAEKLNVKLPCNITFIDITGVKDKWYKKNIF